MLTPALRPGPALPAHSSATAAGVAAIIVALQPVVGVYSGYNGACYFSEELTDPGRTLPQSMFVGTLLVIALFLFINAALLRILTPAALSASTLPAADALATLYGPMARTAVIFVAAASALAVLHATILLAPRILYGMSRDGLFPQSGMYVTRTGVPLVALWMATGIAVAFTQIGNFVFLFALVTVPDETMAKVKIEGMSPNELCCERGTLPRAVPERTLGRPRRFPTRRSPCP